MEHNHSHTHQASAPGIGVDLLAIVGILIVLCAAIAYYRGVRGLRASGRSWPHGRSLAFSGGCALLIVGLMPPLMQGAMDDFRLHMLQHLLIGMLAPLGLVLGAPVSLLLRRLSQDGIRILLRLMRGAWTRFIAHPVIALLLNAGGLYVLYLTPLYTAMHASLLLHAFVHLHVVLAGCLFAWSVLNGPDPVPRRHSIQLRLITLFIGIAAHTLLSKLMYAHGLPAGAHSLDQIRQGAQWMYYGGDVAEILLLVALFSRWHRSTRTAKMRPPIPMKEGLWPG